MLGDMHGHAQQEEARQRQVFVRTCAFGVPVVVPPCRFDIIVANGARATDRNTDGSGFHCGTQMVVLTAIALT